MDCVKKNAAIVLQSSLGTGDARTFFFFVIENKRLISESIWNATCLNPAIMAQFSASEPGMLVLLGGGLLAASLIMRWLLTTVVRAFSRSPKPNLRAQESPLK